MENPGLRVTVASTIICPNEFRVTGMEVGQAVNDMGYAVPLVGRKTTIARAYVDVYSKSTANIRDQAVNRNMNANQPGNLG